MALDVDLVEIDQGNWEEVVDLGLDRDQEDFVASNAYSLAEAAYDDNCYPRAICAGTTLVGFVMFASMAAEGAPGDYMICRLMIDRAHQKKGFGRAALNKTIALISGLPGSTLIKICYHPDNPVAKDFYASFGFVETGLDEDGEMIAERPALPPGQP